MIAATSGPSLAFSASASTRPSGLAGTSSTVKPAKAAVAGLVPWADSGTRTRLRVSPRAATAARIASRPHNSPCAPALGDIATAGMPVSVVSQVINCGNQRQRALGGGARRQGMQIAEAGQPRHLLVQARIVLHGAGAQRIEPGIDGVILPRQPHIMADHFRLAEARQADGALAAQAAQPRVIRLCTSGRSTPVTPSRPISKISRSSMIQAAVAGNGGKLIVLGRCRGREGRP